MKWLLRDIEEELRGQHPPPTEVITTLILLLDTDFMIALLRRNRVFSGPANIAAISHEPDHPLYCKVKRAFELAIKCRRKVGFDFDVWPMRYDPPSRDRRLVWEPETEEVRSAWKMYRQFIREGFSPFTVDSQGEPLLPVERFSPSDGELVFVRRQAS